MRKLASADAKNRFGELLDTAQQEPVAIHKHGRPVAVVISAQEYAEIEAMKLAALKEKVARGLGDADAGRVTDGKAVFNALFAMTDHAED